MHNFLRYRNFHPNNLLSVIFQKKMKVCKQFCIFEVSMLEIDILIFYEL